MPRLTTLACLAAAAGVAFAAHAGTVDVQVTDAAGKPLAGAAVFLESKEARAASKPGPAVDVVQINRQFQPMVTVVPVGTAVNFPNRDTVRHHVYSFSPVKKFEIKLYVGTPAAPVVFDNPGIAVLGCNIHDTMAAWMVVVETPHHGLTGADGRAQPASGAGRRLPAARLAPRPATRRTGAGPAAAGGRQRQPGGHGQAGRGGRPP